MPGVWFVLEGDRHNGPFTSAEFRERAATGQLRPHDLVWKEGMPDWIPASKIKGLFAAAPVTVISPAATTARWIGSRRWQRTAPVTVISPAATTSGESELAAPERTRVAAAVNGWRNLSALAKVGIASASAGLLVVVFCVGVLTLFQGRSDSASFERKREKQKEKEQHELAGHIELGHSLWNEGKKAEAVAEYKLALNYRGESYSQPFFYLVGDTDKPTVLQRTIEDELANGNTSVASHLIKEAIVHWVSLSFNSPEANGLFADIKAERALDEAKREAQNKVDDAEREVRKRTEKSETEPQGPAKGSGWTMFTNGSLTKAKYDKIKEGMSYVEVKGIIGGDGEEMGSSKMDGVSGVVPSISTKMYAWKNSNGSNMNAMFQNDRLIQKAQFGLK